MFIDIVLIILLVLAAIKGYRLGLLVGLFSFVAIFIGLAAAIKLSAVVAGRIGEVVKVSDQWLPVISFAVVFIVVVLLVRWGARLLQGAVEVVMLGWLNRIGGILFFALIYIIVFSVLLFYAEQVHLVQPATIEHSATYSFIQPFGPKAIDWFGRIIPVFRDMFGDLQDFFGGVSDAAQPQPA